MGGFECATHRRRDRSRLDVIAATAHDAHCAEDFRLLRQAGIDTVRDGVRWHLIEATRGSFDWTSLLPLVDAANQTGIQVIWDLCHWGLPDWLDPFSAEFPACFADFAVAATSTILARRTTNPRHPDLFCAINEISFWSWVGGDVEHFYPFGAGRGAELKRQLVRASVAAIRAIRAISPELRFLQPEPIIHISPNRDFPEDDAAVAHHGAAQYEAWDTLAGLDQPELGGADDTLDLIGVNVYWNNQWVHRAERMPPGHLSHQALHVKLEQLWRRYRRPIVISETGAEAAAGAGWLGYICAEIRQAEALGVPILGVCLYPVMDYPGWDDERHCKCGLIEVGVDWQARSLRQDLLSELRIQQFLRWPGVLEKSLSFGSEGFNVDRKVFPRANDIR